MPAPFRTSGWYLSVCLTVVEAVFHTSGYVGMVILSKRLMTDTLPFPLFLIVTDQLLCYWVILILRSAVIRAQEAEDEQASSQSWPRAVGAEDDIPWPGGNEVAEGARYESQMKTEANEAARSSSEVVFVAPASGDEPPEGGNVAHPASSGATATQPVVEHHAQHAPAFRGPPPPPTPAASRTSRPRRPLFCSSSAPITYFSFFREIAPLSVLNIGTGACGMASNLFLYPSVTEAIQMAGPVFQVPLSVLLQGKKQLRSLPVALSLILLSVGGCLSSAGEVNFDAFGMALALCALAFRAGRMLFTSLVVERRSAELAAVAAGACSSDGGSSTAAAASAFPVLFADDRALLADHYQRSSTACVADREDVDLAVLSQGAEEGGGGEKNLATQKHDAERARAVHERQRQTTQSQSNERRAQVYQEPPAPAPLDEVEMKALQRRVVLDLAALALPVNLISMLLLSAFFEGHQPWKRLYEIGSKHLFFLILAKGLCAASWYATEFLLIERRGAVFTSIMANLNRVCCIATGLWVFRNPVSPLQGVGFGLTLLGLGAYLRATSSLPSTPSGGRGGAGGPAAEESQMRSGDAAQLEDEGPSP